MGRVAMEGRWAEQVACDFLRAQGMRIVARNWRWRGGEIDIVAKDGPTLVFVEVKGRASRRFGGPEEAVTAGKRQRLWRAAQAFLGGTAEEVPVRFDVVAVGPDGVRHVRDAFGEEDVRPGA
ncbi:YraN family protein [Candidatus Bipolaricaulota bacterium]|nr:YraN family protein [Candidatus Bipolaricaulota bacterium]